MKNNDYELEEQGVSTEQPDTGAEGAVTEPAADETAENAEQTASDAEAEAETEVEDQAASDAEAEAEAQAEAPEEEPSTADMIREAQELALARETKKKKRKKRLRIVLLVLILVIAGYLGVHKILDYQTMGCRVMVLGEDVSFQTIDSVVEKFQKLFDERQIIFRENGQEIYRISLSDAGYSLNEEHLREKLAKVKAEKPSCKFGFQEWYDYVVFIDTVEDGAALEQALSVDHFGNPDERQESVDAYIQYNEESKQFEIVNSVLGTKIDARKMFRQTEGIVGQHFGEELLGGDIYVDINGDFYQEAAVLESQEALNGQLTQLNTTLNTYRGAEITYTFGSVTEVVGGETLDAWILVDGLNVSINEEAVRSYVSELAAKYNTIYVPRNFHTSYGSDIVISGNEYGYRIDEESEYAQLLSEIQSGTVTSREPVYSHKGYQRNGTDDLMGTYVEVSIDNQHLWLYKDGALITETDIVSGQPTEDRATYRGAFSIAYKESPSVLSSDIYGYETPVQYWMPFVLGQGLHDANWQSSFGGSRYLTNGSHGCINLPPSQAALIYQYVDAGFPILIY